MSTADDLRNAERQGEETDEPEGARYVQLSDTLVNRIADEIEQSFSLLNRCLNVLATTPGVEKVFLKEVDQFVSQRLYSETTKNSARPDSQMGQVSGGCEPQEGLPGGPSLADENLWELYT